MEAATAQPDARGGDHPQARQLTLQQAIGMTVVFLLTRAFILLFLVGRGTDLGLHRDYAAQLCQGEIPFRDFFPEYPPLAFALTGLPALIDRSLEWYAPIFRALCLGFDCLIWFTLVRLNRNGNLAPSQLVLYVLGSTMLGSLIYDRIDIVLGALLLAATVALRSGRYNRFFLAVGGGIAFKLIPVVLVPPFAAAYVRARGRRIWQPLLCLALPTIVSFGAVMALGGYRFDKMFEYHLERGIQIESVPASAGLLGLMFGVRAQVTFGHGSINLRSSYDRELMLTSTVWLAIVILGSTVFAARAMLSPPTLELLFAAVLTSALALSKVLSPQFFVFLLPVLVALPVCRGRGATLVTWLLIASIYVLTGIIFPWQYDQLIRMQPLAQVLLIQRNILLLGLCGWLFYRTWQSGQFDAACPESGPPSAPLAVAPSP